MYFRFLVVVALCTGCLHWEPIIGVEPTVVDPGSGNTGETGTSDNTGSTGNSSGTGSTGDTSNTGSSGNTGNSGATGTAPNAATGLALNMPIADDRVHMTWTDTNSGTAAYRIDRTLGVATTTLTTIAAGAPTTYIDATITLDTTYTYSIIAERDSLTATANSVTASTRPAPPTISAQPLSPSALAVSWLVESTTVTTYRVEESTTSLPGSYFVVQDLDESVTSFMRNGLSVGEARYYRITARGPDWFSAAVDITARSGLPPVLSFGTPVLDDQCHLSVPGIATLDGGATLMSTNGSIALASVTAAGPTGLSGTLTSFTPGSFAVSWTVNDDRGAMATTGDTFTLDVITTSLDTPARPVLASYFEVTDTTQPMPQAAASGVCASCSGRRGSITSGSAHTCVVAPDSTVWCWGYSRFAQLGNQKFGNSFPRTPNPAQVCGDDSAPCSPFLSNVRSVSASDYATCALLEDGSVKCWGDQDEGAVGNGIVTGGSTVECGGPTGVIGGTGMISLTGGVLHNCMLNAAGQPFCFGANTYGQLGIGVTANTGTPVAVAGLGVPLVSMAAGFGHTCGVTNTGGVKCWGRNVKGQLGDGTTGDGSFLRTTPVDVLCTSGSDGCSGPTGPLTNVVEITAGDNHTCALLENQRVKCWGDDANQQLGNGTSTIEQLAAVDVCITGDGVCTQFLENVVQIVAAAGHTCAVISDGTARCWGANGDCQLSGAAGCGSGGTSPNGRVVEASAGVPLTNIVTMAATSGSTCAILSGGRTRCWGLFAQGNLGDGRANNQATDWEPTPVAACITGTCTPPTNEFTSAASYSCSVYDVLP